MIISSSSGVSPNSLSRLFGASFLSEMNLFMALVYCNTRNSNVNLIINKAKSNFLKYYEERGIIMRV